MASKKLVRLAHAAARANAKAAEATRKWAAAFEAEYGHTDLSDPLVEAVEYSNGNTDVITAEFIHEHSAEGQS